MPFPLINALAVKQNFLFLLFVLKLTYGGLNLQIVGQIDLLIAAEFHVFFEYYF